MEPSRRPRSRPPLGLLLAFLPFTPVLCAETPEQLPETLVAAPHLPPWAGRGSYDGATLDRARLQNAPQQRLDSVLRDIPGFRLFRRSDSVVSHPTSQGLSLRNVGPSGASRTDVLLDGVPLNDPFGGWIPWSRLSPLAISSATALRDGGVSPWGNANLGGVLALESRFLQDQPFTVLDAAAGSALDHSVTVLTAQERNGTRIFGGYHHSDFSGYPVIRDSQRGPVDTDAANRSQWWETGLRQNLGRDWSLTLRATFWEESRGTGSPLARNSTDGADFSAKLAWDAGQSEPGAEWIAYRQQRRFQSTFTSIASDRRSELPVLDQFEVPSVATGLIHRNRIPLGEQHLLSSGVDLQQVDGQTQERFRNLGAGYTRTRVAGGDQFEAGAFLQDTWTPDDALQLHAAVRGTFHRNSDGILRESDLESGTPLVDQRYAARERMSLSARTGALFTPVPWLDARLSGYTGSRQPTLNELYRPFRLGATNTLANPELEPEKIHGTDLGLTIRLPHHASLQFGAFYNVLQDPILSITEVQGPGFFPEYGFLPANGVGARRRNIEECVVKGLEAGVRWQISEGLNLHGNWLLTEAEVTRCLATPDLEGRTLAQVPSQQVALGLDGAVWKRLRWTVDGRWVSGQFDDDLNQRRLREFFCVDARIGFQLHENAEIYGAVENLFDAEIQTRVDPSGIVSVASPRIWTAGLRLQF